MVVTTIEKINLFNQITKTQVKADVILGDCLNVLKKLPDNSVDLIVTSPPPMLIKEKALMVELIQINTLNGSCLYQRNYCECLSRRELLF